MPKTEANQTRPTTFEDINGQLRQQHRSTAYGTIHSQAWLPYVHPCSAYDLFEAGHFGRDPIVLGEEKSLTGINRIILSHPTSGMVYMIQCVLDPAYGRIFCCLRICSPHAWARSLL